MVSSFSGKANDVNDLIFVFFLRFIYVFYAYECSTCMDACMASDPMVVSHLAIAGN